MKGFIMKRAFPRITIPICAILLIFLAAMAGTVTAQEQPAQPAVQTICPHVLKSGIPFAWLRFEPSSFSGFSITMLPGQTVQLNEPPALVWDGVQWWAYVWPNFSSAKGYYWVELNSLEPRCQPPTPTPSSGAAPWGPGNLVRVRLNIPFVWFRAAPAPGNPPVHTVLPGAKLAIVQGPPVQDSFGQWWWLMRDTRDSFTGWVEQNSVELIGDSSTPVPPGSWLPGDIVRVRLNIPFSWLRFEPKSTSGFTFTAQSGQQLVVRQGPQHDGVQNWWMVAIRNSSATGWVEEGSMEFVRRGT
jgi:hypothetical protein